MKILITVNDLTSRGGAQLVIYKLAKYLGRKNEVSLLALSSNANKTGFDFGGFELIDLKIGSGNLVVRQVRMLLKLSLLRLDAFDVINVHEFPYTALALRNGNVIWYCHTPPRLLYDMRADYLERVHVLLRPLLALYIYFMRLIDGFIVKRIPVILANSVNVQKRIKKYYGRDSVVVYPGVSVDRSVQPVFKKYILAVSRLRPEKRVELTVRAMEYLKDYELCVVGEGPETERIREAIKERGLTNVKLLGGMDNERLKNLYTECFCVIHVPKDEDFGLIPLEANSFGKMIIGSDEGGLKETIIHGVTGMLISEPDPVKIAKAVRDVERIGPETKSADCSANAERFSWERFNEGFEREMNSMRQLKKSQTK